MLKSSSAMWAYAFVSQNAWHSACVRIVTSAGKATTALSANAFETSSGPPPAPRPRRIREDAEEDRVLGVGVVNHEPFAPWDRPPHPAALVEAPEERIDSAEHRRRLRGELHGGRDAGRVG